MITAKEKPRGIYTQELIWNQILVALISDTLVAVVVVDVGRIRFRITLRN